MLLCRTIDINAIQGHHTEILNTHTAKRGYQANGKMRSPIVPHSEILNQHELAIGILVEYVQILMEDLLFY